MFFDYSTFFMINDFFKKSKPFCRICRANLWTGFYIIGAFFMNELIDNSSVIGQKGESQNGCFKKTKDVKFSKKRTFLNP